MENKFCEYLTDDFQCMIDGEPCEFEDEKEAEDLCENLAFQNQMKKTTLMQNQFRTAS